MDIVVPSDVAVPGPHADWSCRDLNLQALRTRHRCYILHPSMAIDSGRWQCLGNTLDASWSPMGSLLWNTKLSCIISRTSSVPRGSVHAEERAMRIDFVYWEITVTIYTLLTVERKAWRKEDGIVTCAMTLRKFSTMGTDFT